MAGLEMLLELPVELLEHVVQAAVEKAWSTVSMCSHGGAAVEPCSGAPVQGWSCAAVEPWSRGASELRSRPDVQSCSCAVAMPWSAAELSGAAVRPWVPVEGEELPGTGRVSLAWAELGLARRVQPCSLVEQTRRMLGSQALPRPPEVRRGAVW